MPVREIEFDKYKKRGDYHWQGLRKNVFAFNAFLQARYRLVLAQLPKLKRRNKVVDIGCGDGVLSYLIRKEKGGQVYGIDPVKKAIDIARKKIKKTGMKNCFFKTGSVYKLPFKDSNFSYAVVADVIEHVSNQNQLLKEIRKVLKPKGKLILSSVIKSTLKPEDKMHVKEYTVEEMKNLLKKYFTNIKIIESHPLFLKKIYQWYFRIGKYRPQPFRYLVNLLTILVGVNPFLFPKTKSFSCQTAICEVKK